METVANAVAKAQRIDSSLLWDGDRCIVELEDFRKYNLSRKLTDLVRPLRFKAKHNQRRYSLWGFTEEAIDDYRFEDSHGDGGGGMISVRAWTERTYGITLRYGHLPGIKTVSQEDEAKGKKQVVIPLELAQLQDAEVGDGTTSVVILAAELLKRAIERGIWSVSLAHGYADITEALRRAAAAMARHASTWTAPA